MSRESNLTFNNIIGFNSLPAIDIGFASATEHAISAGKGTLYFQNTGNKKVWFGSSNVDGDTKIGTSIFPNEGFFIDRPSKEFSVYFICAGSDTSTISINEGVLRWK